jgi:hypothetical protein
LLASSAACKSRDPYATPFGSDPNLQSRSCGDPITTRTTLAEFITTQTGHWPGAWVERGCGYTEVLLPAMGGVGNLCEPVVVPPTTFTWFAGLAYFFDGSGELVGEFVGSDEASEISCTGTVWMRCESVTRCSLDWSYPRTGGLCMHSADAGGDSDAGGPENMCSQ